MKKKSINEDKKIEWQHVSEEKSREEKVKSGNKMSDQKKESAIKEKGTIEQGSCNKEQSVTGSISTSSEECECKKSVVSTKESKGKTKEKEEKEEKQDETEKCEEEKEEMSSILFKGDKREEMKESCCDISSPLNSLSSKEVNLFTKSNNHFLVYLSPRVQKFEAQNMENEGSLGYKLYKIISFLHSTSFLFFDS
ncbi:hypothetical protein M9H77_17211 [Catharanthus roseus]|uniref:Uncharacterized protein n=1 Tax=Catharanthus roseus TaxID=4058 RepID=A0ACC0B4C3_CATRO|nr:hypothetical protein M9H77_17211 [Catharanthus roseus]